MMLEELKRRNIPLNIKDLISDFKLNILKAIWKKVQVNGFATQFDEQPDFHRCVKSTLALDKRSISSKCLEL